MLYAFGFERLTVLVGDLYFQHPDPPDGQEGPEHGVRLELRRIEAGELRGSVYSARPISVEEPIWRADLLESVHGVPGSFDRTHHHPRFTGWDEGERRFADDLSSDPVGWLEAELTDLPRLLARSGAEPGTAGPGDVTGLRFALPDILGAVRRLLDGVRASVLARPPDVASDGLIRSGWL